VTTEDPHAQIAFEAAEQRVISRLRSAVVPERSPTRRATIVAIAALLFAATFTSRMVIHDPGALLANFYVVPTAVLAIEFGVRGGVTSAAVAMALVFAWGALETIHVTPLGYVSRLAAVLVTGVVAGRFSERQRQDIAERRREQHDLTLYADGLERANERLTRSVRRLGAFTEIANAVGGETELDRVLALIAARGRAIVGAERMLVCLADGAELVALDADEPLRLPATASVAGAVLADGESRRLVDGFAGDALLRGARAAILVPLTFRGERLGVLVGIDREDGRPFEAADEQLLQSVAASAATAVSTARSVAAEHLRLSLEAAEQARARWARELHDETLQGLTGVRMALGAALGREDPAALRRAAEAADEHLGAEMRGLRDLITELRPAALDDLGLGPAIESLVHRQAAAGGFTTEFRLALDGGERPRELEATVYRLVQEALSNVVRHADAGHVELGIRQAGGTIEIDVTDDGHGFEPSSHTEGFGLAGMRERTLLLGGRFHVRSAAGGPTRVTAVLPLRRGVGLSSGPAPAGRPSTT
jgi:signal transduction histidine kinase